jgi:hypothetical protein
MTYSARLRHHFNLARHQIGRGRIAFRSAAFLVTSPSPATRSKRLFDDRADQTRLTLDSQHAPIGCRRANAYTVAVVQGDPCAERLNLADYV